MNMAESSALTAEQLERLRSKARWVWEQTLLIHRRAPETRVASSLSPIEIFVCLYYGGLLRFDAHHPLSPGRDRCLISKGHGSVSLYPILVDVGFFPPTELERVCQRGSFLGGIPDPVIPGYETVNGSLGHGPGVGCGMALALKRRGLDNRVFVMVGDGELYEGAVWEAIMFAGHHRLDNLILLVDDNTRCMLNYSARVLNLAPVAPKLEAFGWRTREVDGHDIAAVHSALRDCRDCADCRPRALIAHTIKGRGVPSLEDDPLCHIKTIGAQEIDALIGGRHA